MGEENARAFIAMEFLEGRTLKHTIEFHVRGRPDVHNDIHSRPRRDEGRFSGRRGESGYLGNNSGPVLSHPTLHVSAKA
jgi:hypothetical protein